MTQMPMMSNSLPTSTWSDRWSLIFSGDEYFENLLEQINLAQKSILIESYIFHLDPIGMKILHALGLASQRGVQIRLLVDGIGSYFWLPRLIKECESKKISCRVYHPFPFGTTFWLNLSWKKFHYLLWIFQRINKRNHRKLALIDETTVFTGSFNISKVHSKIYMGEKAWRDSGIIFTPAQTPQVQKDIQTLIVSFNEAWDSSEYFHHSNFRSLLQRKRMTKTLDSRFRLNSRTYWRFLLLRDLNRKFLAANERIYITNAYFLPRKSILKNLRKKARKNIPVLLLLPRVTDIWFVREASRSLYTRLLKSGVRIFEYEKSILHAKTLIIDSWATVGSHNLNHRSFNHDLEVEAVITEPSLINELLEQWEKDLKNAKEISLSEVNNVNIFRKVLGRIFYWFRFWL